MQAELKLEIMSQNRKYASTRGLLRIQYDGIASASQHYSLISDPDVTAGGESERHKKTTKCSPKFSINDKDNHPEQRQKRAELNELFKPISSILHTNEPKPKYDSTPQPK